MRKTRWVLAMVWGASITANAQQIPIRQLGPAEAVAAEKIDALSLIRPLSDGRVVVAKGKRVLVFASDLATFSVAVDSTAITAGPIPMSSSMPVAILPGLGDTTYAVDQYGGGLIVVDPTGKSGRMIAMPKASDISAISSGFGYIKTFTDPKGRLLYRGFFRPPPPPPGTIRPPLDTFPLVRADFDSRSVDTIAVLRIPSSTRSNAQMDNGRMTMRVTLGAYPTVDVWTMMQDGTIAIVRGSDYHVDWIQPDGSRSASPKMQFDWRRLGDDEKVRIADSLQTFVNRMMATQDSVSRARGLTSSASIAYDVAPANTLPDYYPPVRDGSARADADGNLWILPTTSASAQGGLLYDVVNRKGEIFERVQLPGGCALAGFAKARVVYLTCVATSLERRRVTNAAQ